MAQVFELCQVAEACSPPLQTWDQVPNAPGNVLVIPSRQPPAGPTAPQTNEGTALIYESDLSQCADSSCCVVIAHDSVSGWWVEINDRCPAPDDTNVPGECCVEGTPPDGSSAQFDSAGNFLGWALDLSLIDARPLIPAWAKADVEQPAILDAWGVVCCPGAVILVTTTTQPNPPAGGQGCPPGEAFSAQGCRPFDAPVPAFLPDQFAISRVGGALRVPITKEQHPAHPMIAIPTPLRIPIPTDSIAPTACNCGGEGEELDV